jgi:hypothetical protein
MGFLTSQIYDDRVYVIDAPLKLTTLKLMIKTNFLSIKQNLGF